jgi:hypothetical protein
MVDQVVAGWGFVDGDGIHRSPPLFPLANADPVFAKAAPKTLDSPLPMTVSIASDSNMFDRLNS